MACGLWVACRIQWTHYSSFETTSGSRRDRRQPLMIGATSAAWPVWPERKSGLLHVGSTMRNRCQGGVWTMAQSALCAGLLLTLRETIMKRFILSAALLGGFFAFTATEASAVVCARGVYRAGCAGPHGAVVGHRGY